MCQSCRSAEYTQKARGLLRGKKSDALENRDGGAFLFCFVRDENRLSHNDKELNKMLNVKTDASTAKGLSRDL